MHNLKAGLNNTPEAAGVVCIASQRLLKVNTEKPETGGGPGSHGGRERGAAAGAAAIALIVSFRGAGS